MAYIYVITNNINGKQYVGKTSDSIEKRFKEHINDSLKRKFEKRPLYDAINKYGSKNFSIQKLEECSYNEASTKEIYWIGKLNTYKNGYNATLGGDGRSLRDYKEISDAYLEFGTVKAVCEKLKCDASTVKKACNEYNIEIIPASNHISKSVAMLDENENVLKTFSSLKEAGQFLGDPTKSKHIGKVCNGLRKKAYGYKWKYI